MSEIQLRRLKAALKDRLQDHIDMSDVARGDRVNQDIRFYSRALAAFALQVQTGIDEKTAGSAVVDMQGDNGIDAIHFHAPDKVLYVVQSKWKTKGSGSFSLADNEKFMRGVRKLLNLDISDFSEKVLAREKEIESALYDAGVSICMLYTYSGQHNLSPEVEKDVEGFLKEINSSGEVLHNQVLNLKKLYDALTHEVYGAPANLDISLEQWGSIEEPYHAYYGQVSATEVANWYRDHNPSIFAPNIRYFLKDTEVNESIRSTLYNAPHNFWYFNNGVTLLAKSVRKKPIGSGSTKMAIFECKGVAIVNGAQTVGTIGNSTSLDSSKLDNALVAVRLINLEGCPEGFEAEITRATNTQNKIDKRDFVSLDPVQDRLKIELHIEGIDYVYKSGDTISDHNNGFDLVEATIALACGSADTNLAVLAKRNIGSLWQDPEKKPYKALFNQQTNSSKLWKYVKLLRLIDTELDRLKNEVKDKSKTLILVHGNRFITSEVFFVLTSSGSQGVDKLTSKLSEITSSVVTKVITTYASEFGQHIPITFFKNTKMCNALSKSIRNEKVEKKLSDLQADLFGDSLS